MDSLRIKNRRTWFRYSEGKGGDAIAFLQRFEGKTFPEAVDFLLAWNGRSRDAPDRPPPVQQKERTPPPVTAPFVLPPAKEAAERMKDKYTRQGCVVSYKPPPRGKDWNEYLQHRQKCRRQER